MYYVSLIDKNNSEFDIFCSKSQCDLDKFTTFASVTDEDSVETEVLEVMESDSELESNEELVEADTTENDSIEQANLVEETIDADLDETAVVEDEAVVEEAEIVAE